MSLQEKQIKFEQNKKIYESVKVTFSGVDGFDVYQVKQNIIKRQLLKRWNPIDMGIAISHMYIANENTFEFKIKDNFDELKGYTYIGSIKI